MDKPKTTVISDDLRQAIKRNTRAYFLINFSAGVVFGLIGIVVMAIALQAEPASRTTWLIVGIVLLAVGVGDCLYYWRTRVDVTDLIERHPRRIVWVYKKVNVASPYGIEFTRFHFLMFGLDNKRRVQVRLSARDADRLIGELQSALPHATFGYTPELERKYKSDPQALLRN